MRKLFFAATSLLFIIPCLANNGDEIPLSKDSFYEYDNRNEQSVPAESDKYQAHLSSNNVVMIIPSHTEEFSVTIYNKEAMEIEYEGISDNGNTIFSHQLTKGSYIIKVEDDEISYTGEVCVE